MKTDSLKTLIKISRPRFWIYTGGTFLIGYMYGLENYLDFLSLEMFLYFFYFLIFANLFVYGVNDLYDEETDKHNPKKFIKENNLTEDFKPLLKFSIVCVFTISLALIFFLQKSLGETIIFLAFLFFSFFYSAHPLRFKSKPILDFSSNILYAVPGIFGYYLVTQQLPSFLVLLAIYLWTSAMHVYSAVPDIEYDKGAGLKTTAVKLGGTYSLLLCVIFWSLASYLTFVITNNVYLGLISYVYPLMPLYALLSKDEKVVNRLYWVFPYLNLLMGLGLFWLLAVSKFF